MSSILLSFNKNSPLLKNFNPEENYEAALNQSNSLKSAGSLEFKIKLKWFVGHE